MKSRSVSAGSSSGIVKVCSERGPMIYSTRVLRLRLLRYMGLTPPKPPGDGALESQRIPYLKVRGVFIDRPTVVLYTAMRPSTGFRFHRLSFQHSRKCVAVGFYSEIGKCSGEGFGDELYSTNPTKSHRTRKENLAVPFCLHDANSKRRRTQL